MRGLALLACLVVAGVVWGQSPSDLARQRQEARLIHESGVSATAPQWLIVKTAGLTLKVEKSLASSVKVWDVKTTGGKVSCRLEVSNGTAVKVESKDGTIKFSR